MAKHAAPQKRLKLYTEQPPKNVRPQIEAVACLPELCRAFQKATGWTLRYGPKSDGILPAGPTWSASVAGGSSFEPGILGLEKVEKTVEGGGRKTDERKNWRSAAGNDPIPNFQSPVPAFAPAPIERGSAQSLAGSIADLLGELLETRRALWQREAELAAGVPLVPHREEEKHLAAAFGSRVAGGAEAVGGDAIALYLLDEATTELKLRSSWGLPFDRLAAPARPLKGAVADLEAMLGHAVVLDDPNTTRVWNVPEEFPAAVCVPVSTPTTLLGTLWVYQQRKTRFQRPRNESSRKSSPAGSPRTWNARCCCGREPTERSFKNKSPPPSGCNATACPRSRRCWTVGVWPAGRPKPKASAGLFTIGSACLADCWRWRSARPPNKASPAR